MNWQSLKTFISALWLRVVSCNGFSRLILPVPILAPLSWCNKRKLKAHVLCKHCLEKQHHWGWYSFCGSLWCGPDWNDAYMLFWYIVPKYSKSVCPPPICFGCCIICFTHAGGHCLVQGVPDSWYQSSPVEGHNALSLRKLLPEVFLTLGCSC